MELNIALAAAWEDEWGFEVSSLSLRYGIAEIGRGVFFSSSLDRKSILWTVSGRLNRFRNLTPEYDKNSSIMI